MSGEDKRSTALEIAELVFSLREGLYAFRDLREKASKSDECSTSISLKDINMYSILLGDAADKLEEWLKER